MNLINGDCQVELKKIKDNSVDLIVTDPPYGMSFMGKDWDRAVPSIDIWRECFRVLKDGAFAFVMCIPRQDCLAHMIYNLGEAGFETGFTSMYWTYASGFPKAGNIGKMVDKRNGIVSDTEIRNIAYPDSGCWGIPNNNSTGENKNPTSYNPKTENINIGKGTRIHKIATSPEAKALDGSYAGFQPKPAVEVILVVMKPLSKKTYVEQALDNQKGITWLDDCRVPYESEGDKYKQTITEGFNGWKDEPTKGKAGNFSPQGRFPANLLVSDDVLNDGKTYKSGDLDKEQAAGDSTVNCFGAYGSRHRYSKGDSCSYSRYFDLDKWYNKVFPFFICPKASKSEKNKGCEGLEANDEGVGCNRPSGQSYERLDGRKPRQHQNNHPTCKPLKLMCYLITLGSRQKDIVLDPFMGSGTTGVACNMTSREFIGMEIDKDYFKIAEARCSHKGEF